MGFPRPGPFPRPLKGRFFKLSPNSVGRDSPSFHLSFETPPSPGPPAAASNSALGQGVVVQGRLA